jgi:hypothetical protein
MWAYIKRWYFRWQRSKKVCQQCGKHGTLERPLMFSVEDNYYHHFPSCTDVTEFSAERHDMVFNG